MAAKLRITPAQFGLSHIYNVSAHVGGLKAAVNTPDDVMLVQYFISEVVPKLGTRTIEELPALTGRIDAVTSYWIYHLQNTAGTSGTVDGVVSPARGVTYSAVQAWTIAQLNFQFKKFFPERFDRIPDDPRLSPSLRAALRN